MRKCIWILFSLAMLGAVRMFSHALAVHQGKLSYLPKNVQEIATFNDCLMFKRDKDNPKRFVFRDNMAGNVEAYLRFAIPDFDPSAYRLVLRLRSRPDLLRQSKIRSARDTLEGGDVMGDIATYQISMRDASSFVWSDKKCYVGVMFPKPSLKSGDVVELLDFKFSLR